MATTITNVTELQAINDNLAGDYILGNNIDASATSGWNDGAGFDPIGSGTTLHSYSRPESDDFGYAGQSGSWTIYPSDGVFYDKVDEETPDDDSTYIQAVTSGSYALLAHDATALDIPDDATDITVAIRARVRNVASGTSYIQGMVNINGTEYLVGSNLAVSSESYANKSWTMNDYPPMGFGGWTVGNVFSLAVAGVGVKVSDASPDVRITQLYIDVAYKRKFSGKLDGAEYTISDLYINRPTEDDIGLFGYTDGATIQGVTIANCNYTILDDAGALVGESNNDTITNCHSSGSITGRSYIGGLIGFSNNSAISRCSSSVKVSGNDFTGGLIGWSYQCTISQCFAKGDVTGTDDYAGGLIGVSQEDDIDDCYARGNVAADRYVGGLIAYFYGATKTIDNCYSTGAVTGNSDVGGLIGYSDS